MLEAEWALALLRGVAGLATFAGVFLAARKRFVTRDLASGPGDNGMD